MMEISSPVDIIFLSFLLVKSVLYRLTGVYAILKLVSVVYTVKTVKYITNSFTMINKYLYL